MLPILLMFADTNAADEAPLPRQWAQFSRSGALSHVTETVDIATASRARNAPFRYRLRYTRKSLEGPAEVKWADSAACPAVAPVIASMRTIEMPAPAPYGVDEGELKIVLDGMGYSLTAPSSYSNGKLTITSNVGSPLATWISGAFKQLEACWTSESP